MFVLYTFLSLYTIKARLCDPYAFRLSLGHYYTILNYTGDVLRVSFNSEGPCKSVFILQIGNNQIFEYETSIIDTNQMYRCENYHSFVHTFKISLKHIVFDTLIDYYVQEGNQIFGPFTFKVPRKSTYSKLLIFGNLDAEWTQNSSWSILNFLENSIFLYKTYDAILYMGNIIHKQEDNNCQKGDFFIKQMQNFTSSYPFMVSSGNLDFGIARKQSFVKQQFKMPFIQEYGLNSMELYSFDLGFAHIIQINPFQMIYLDNRANFVDILEDDLQKNTDKWLIIFTYYPFQCWDKCEYNQQKIKDLIDLANKYKVDIVFSSQQNIYKRLKSEDNSFVQIIEGVGGNFQMNQTFGIGELKIHNSTHLQFQHRESDQVVDEFWLIKEQSKSSLYIVILIIVFISIQLILSYRCFRRWKLQRFTQL